MPARSVYQMNACVWLGELAAGLGRPATISDIPDRTFEEWLRLAFDFIWFLGV
jgi:hypothetical protein